ncbi:hypothetical protein BPS26883_06145 [Burkholderia pseudomultivorans]|uniref:Uncharacterized protein n=1 Tax=Burkholderia pseudomultivorans TaxID=1207504 RepID=A0A6P2QUZ0_9BURK|nr:hypothetical protein [Burkholderia pseudomultivorans]VWC26261.1 hypothetical protein BPS26883_06145 [Burkholderia pseudomultivorans]
MKVVKFQRHYAQYTPGDVAGFEDEHADRLVEAQIARVHGQETKDAKAPPKAETSKPGAAKG